MFTYRIEYETDIVVSDGFEVDKDTFTFVDEKNEGVYSVIDKLLQDEVVDGIVKIDAYIGEELQYTIWERP